MRTYNPGSGTTRMKMISTFVLSLMSMANLVSFGREWAWIATPARRLKSTHPGAIESQSGHPRHPVLRLRGGDSSELREVEKGIGSLELTRSAQERANDIRILEQLEMQIAEERIHQRKLAERIQETSNRLSQLEFQRSRLQKQMRAKQAGRATNTSAKPIVPAKQPLALSAAADESQIIWREPTFAWSEPGYGKMNISVYIHSGIEGVGHLPRDQVTVKLTEQNFEVKIRDLRGKHFRLQRKLLHPISPLRSSYKVTTNQLHLYLAKKDPSKVWGSLHRQWKPPSSERTAFKAEKDDPMGSLWNLMQDMYEEGDDKTKSLIKKAVHDARKAGPDPVNGKQSLPPAPPAAPGEMEALLENFKNSKFPDAPPLYTPPRPGQQTDQAQEKPLGYGGKASRKVQPPPPPPLPSSMSSPQ